MAVQFESKLLDLNYIDTQVKDLQDVKRGNITYTLRYSDNHAKGSNSIYLTFTHKRANGFEIHGATLRISDHKARVWNELEFLVDPNVVLTNKRKQALVKAIERCLSKSKTKIHAFLLNHINV